MKYLLIVLALNFTTAAFAEEVKTECPFINKERDKNVREVKEQPVRSQSSSVIRQ